MVKFSLIIRWSFNHFLRPLEKMREKPTKLADIDTDWRNDMRYWASKLVVALAVCLCLSGCSYTLSDIRKYEPYQTITSSKPPLELAKCIEIKIREQTERYWCEAAPAISFEEYPNNTYRVVLLVPPPGARGDILVKPMSMGTVVESGRIQRGWAGDGAMGDILVKPASGGTVVEFRRIAGAWPGDSLVPEVIKGCAQ